MDKVNVLKWSVIVFLVANISFAEVEIQSFNNKHFWKKEWTNFMLEELKKDQYRVGKNALLNMEINADDLKELNCLEYNQASLDEKSEFWVVFFSSLARAESSFNEKAVSPVTKGHKSFGLLQIAKGTAKTNCDSTTDRTNVFDPLDNLKCGIKLMAWQLSGPRLDLVGRIFSKRMFQWGPLYHKDRGGRMTLKKWFYDHLPQLKYCDSR